MKYAKQYNPDLVYSYGYDWRESPIDCADGLNDFINYVKARTGAKKVNVVAISQGSAVTLAYLSQYGGSSVNNLVFASPAWQGTALAGDVFTGNLNLDIYAFENFLVGMSDGSATTHIIAVLLSIFATQEEFTEEYFFFLQDAVKGMQPQIYDEIIIDIYDNVSDEFLASVILKEYVYDIIKFIDIDIFKEENYSRYREFFNGNYEKTVLHVNIGLDKDFYTDTDEIL